MKSLDATLFSQLHGFSDYISVTPNAVIRLSNETASNIEGLSTYAIKTCIGVILYNNSGRMSLAHVRSMKTDIEKSMKREVEWIGELSSITAIIVQNRKFLIENPHQIINVTQCMNEIKESLHSNGIPVDNISLQYCDHGAVAINRVTKRIVFPVVLDDHTVTIVGTPCPYLFLRNTIGDLSFENLVPLEIQFDCLNWTKIEAFNHPHYDIQYTEKQLEKYKDLQPRAVEKLLRKEECIIRLKNKPYQFLYEAEFDGYITSQSISILNYLTAKQEYEQSKVPYKMLKMTAEQRGLINSIDGTINPVLDRDMYVVNIPTRYLIEKVRKVLCIDRVGLQLTSVDVANKYAAKLSAHIKGWRGEEDFKKEGSFLITFPYNDENHRKVLREKLKGCLR